MLLGNRSKTALKSPVEHNKWLENLFNEARQYQLKRDCSKNALKLL